MMFYCYHQSPIGPLLLVSNSTALTQIRFPIDGQPDSPEPEWRKGERPLREVVRQLHAYFSGKLESFEVELAPEGTAFQQKVWKELLKIPYGETISYGELARRIEHPNASRAVGLANGSNPIPIIIPCHRVIGSNGKLTGYGGGLPIKEKLLALEKRQLQLL
jgi:methylated-DNA-[protein]-cysteine S-methyltransferase